VRLTVRDNNSRLSRKQTLKGVKVNKQDFERLRHNMAQMFRLSFGLERAFS
jgi:hypothetical protein